MYEYIEPIYVDEKKCVGCNKCLSNCPVQGANVAYIVDGNNKIKINNEKCIHCGKCIKLCDHNARYYVDDTRRFFDDLKKGKELSVIAAPSIRLNFDEYKRIFGCLKQLGVNFIYDVSFGADIAIWAYTKMFEKNNVDTVITQPCPPIVNYIEKYEPELIEKLAPIQSPMLCTAIYMKKYAKIDDDIAFLSPCIAKSDEINDKNTYGYVKYNVTFKKLIEYFQENSIDIAKYREYDFDYMNCDLGFLFSRPGGFTENINQYMKDSWIRQISGTQNVYNYLNDYKINLKSKKQMPLIVDALNCSNGCNCGTGTCDKFVSYTALDDIDYKMNILKKNRIIENSAEEPKEIHNYFNNNLKLEDFKRAYNRDVIVNGIIEPSDEQYDEIFIKMNKLTKESRNINCLACGYGSCKIMAKCIFNKLNVLSNCIDYNKKEIINEHNLLETRNEFFTNISHELRTPLNVIYSVLQLESVYKNNLDIENIEKYNKIIKQNCLRLIRLVNNVIDISRIEAGFFKPLFKIENIVSEVENIALSIKTYVENKKMNLIFDTEMEELYINCDTNLIERIMLNLLSNSVKYGKENGIVKIYIYKKDPYNVVISVKDDGIGIPEKMQMKIFERFQKVDTSLSRKNEGSGIGLSLVKSLVELQGGTIRCKSKVKQGSEFLVTFPIDNQKDKSCEEIKKHMLYEKNSTETVDIEFSDIYF